MSLGHFHHHVPELYPIYDIKEADADDDDADNDDDRTMVALVHDRTTHTLSLATMPLPVPSAPDEHLVRVHAVALTHGELTWSSPGLAVPGYEFSGTVVLAPLDSPFQPGADVYVCTGVHGTGSACEYTLSQTHEMCQKPENLSWEEAATVPWSALAAWQALFVHGGIRPPLSLSPMPPPPTSFNGTANGDKRVLVTAAAGGVGLWAVQLARLAGVGHVTGMCGPANRDFVRSLGAHRVADYPADDAYDLVVDCMDGGGGGGGGENDALPWEWDGGRRSRTVVCIESGTKTVVMMGSRGNGVESTQWAVQADNMQLQEVTDLVETGAAKAVFDSAFVPEQYEAALARMQDRHLRGKVVLRLD